MMQKIRRVRLGGRGSRERTFQTASAKADPTNSKNAADLLLPRPRIRGEGWGEGPFAPGTAKINGVGIRTGKFLFVSTGTGADVNIAKFKIENGTMNADWFKLGSTEMGGKPRRCR